MKKIQILSTIVFVTCFCLAAAGCSSNKMQVPDSDRNDSQKTEPPLWMTDEGRHSVFPDSEYISAFASGSDAESAKVKAAEQISEYIKSSITSSVNYSAVNGDESVSQKIQIQTDNILFNTEYTVPYYSSRY